VHRALAGTLREADVTHVEITRADGGGEPATIAANAVITTLGDQDDVTVQSREAAR
jgi:hypothetical protein